MNRLAATLLLTVALVAPSARGENACVTAYEGGQRARLDRDLVRAKTELSRCARSDCNSIIQTDCSEWLREVERAIPTLIVSVRYDNGRDITDARVSVDGKPVAERTDGKPFSVNPGEHRVRVDYAGAKAEQVMVAIQGEHDRVLRFTLISPPKPTTPPPGTPSEAPSADSGGRSGPGVLPFVLAGVSAVSLGGFAYYAITGRRDLKKLRDDCAPDCSDKRLDEVKRKLLVADILLGVAVISGGAATYLFVTSGGENRDARIGIAGRF